jgi:hypothetical protein
MSSPIDVLLQEEAGENSKELGVPVQVRGNGQRHGISNHPTQL